MNKQPLPPEPECAPAIEAERLRKRAKFGRAIAGGDAALDRITP
jgi:hypothetical protein